MVNDFDPKTIRKDVDVGQIRVYPKGQTGNFKIDDNLRPDKQGDNPFDFYPIGSDSPAKHAERWTSFAGEYKEGRDKLGRRYCTEGGKRVKCHGAPMGAQTVKPKKTVEHTVDSLHAHIEQARKEGLTPEKLTAIAGHLQHMKVADLKLLEKKLGAKVEPASLKAERVKAIKSAVGKTPTAAKTTVKKAATKNPAVKKTSAAEKGAQLRANFLAAKSKQSAEAEAIAASAASFGNMQAHGMSKNEEMSGTTVNGIPMAWSKGAEKYATAVAAHLKTAMASMPSKLVRATKSIAFSSQVNKEDEYWSKTYNIANFRSNATGGDGTIVSYDNGSGENPAKFADIFAHESGHNFATETGSWE